MIKNELKDILKAINREDILCEIKENFTLEEQDDLFSFLKEIMADEFAFVIALKKIRKERG